MATLQAAHRRDPQDARGKQWLGEALAKRAEVRTRFKRPDAIKDWDRALELDPGPGRARLRLARARALARLGEHRRAAAEGEAVLKSPRGQASLLYDVAAVYALASVATRDDARPSGPNQEKLAERYAGRAVTLLTQARAAGHFKSPARVKQLKKDKNFEELRGRPDFQKLLAGLEGKTQPGAR